MVRVKVRAGEMGTRWARDAAVEAVIAAWALGDMGRYGQRWADKGRYGQMCGDLG